MEIVLVTPVVIMNSILPHEREEAEKLTAQRNDMLESGYTIKETRLAVFNDKLYAHYVMSKE